MRKLILNRAMDLGSSRTAVMKLNDQRISPEMKSTISTEERLELSSYVVFTVIFISTILSSTLPSFSQTQYSTKNKKALELYFEADNFRVRGDYERSISFLKEAINKDKNFEEAYFRLGLTYKNKEDLKSSTDYFEKGLALAKDIKKQNGYRFELGDNFLRMGSYPQALDQIGQFLLTEKQNTLKIDQAKVWKQHAEYGVAHQNEKLPYSPKVLSDTLNCFPMQYFPVLTADNQQIIFTKRYGRGHDDDEDLVISVKNKTGQWTTPVAISEKINSTAREGACTISADGRYLIFTLCGTKTYGRCDLFESKKVGDGWSVPVNLGPLVNGSSWDVQPSLSADGQELYFVSDRKGGIGGSDIWYSRKDSVGRWMKARNLGSAVNTKYDEISPFIHVNNRNLYFSSNAHPGFGGLDIFVTEKKEKTWTTPQNMGSPLNNHEDQFAFYVTSDGKRAYYSKDEAEKKNFTKIFSTVLPSQVQVQYSSSVVKGKVRDKENGQPLNARVELYDIQKDERISIVQSDSISGEYTIVLTKGAEYALYVSRPDYLFQSLSFNYTSGDHSKPVEINIDLQKVKANAAIVLYNIFFDVNKYELKEKSTTELEEVIRFLTLNPALQVEIGGHTDNSGAADYNLKLSEQRAQSVANYLTQNGIDAQRISKKGYGALQPVKPNDTENNRQANRRIEFKIIR